MRPEVKESIQSLIESGAYPKKLMGLNSKVAGNDNSKQADNNYLRLT